jgi:DNA-binding NarL/FixJ family response regulator
MLTFALTRAGMKVVATASDGKQAVEATIQSKPDILLLDIAMPLMDGFASLANIKFLAPETPIIIVSALKNPSCKTRALELGADAFFLKGESLVDDLTEIIYTLVSGECTPTPSKKSTEPIFPTMPKIKLLLEDQEPSTI